MNKRAQAALEFLTTYGWALLVILVMIGALVYFGLLNPNRALPARCDVPPGWQCKDYQVTEGQVNVILANKNGEAIKDFVMVSRTSDADGIPDTLEASTQCGASKSSLPADETVTISCNATTGTPTEFFNGLSGEKIKVEFGFAYNTTRGTYTKSFSMTLFAPVQ